MPWPKSSVDDPNPIDKRDPEPNQILGAAGTNEKREHIEGAANTNDKREPEPVGTAGAASTNEKRQKPA